MLRIKRVFRHVDDLEEACMWRAANGDEAERFIVASYHLMQNRADFKAAMLRALADWPNSCEHNLSAMAMNRRAWLGHAGCCVALGSPEAMTRLGWHRLSMDEQIEANAAADEAIAIWEAAYLERTNA